MPRCEHGWRRTSSEMGQIDINLIPIEVLLKEIQRRSLRVVVYLVLPNSTQQEQDVFMSKGTAHESIGMAFDLAERMVRLKRDKESEHRMVQEQAG